jgi:cytoskeleton protein RodZ
VIRQRGAATRRRDDEEDGTDSSAKEIGTLLREAREERGLDLLAVHDRLSRPITQLEALELGDLDRLPDQALALSTLRRYAAFLGLDGDALALRMIDAWSAAPATASVAAHNDNGAAATNVVAAVSTGPDHLRAFTQTGPVPMVRAGTTTALANYGYEVNTGPPTGTFPVVPRQELKESRRAVAKARRKQRAPASLKAFTWVVGILLIVAVAGSVILSQRPQWLASAHILRVVGTGGAPAGPSSAPKASSAAVPVVSTSTSGQTSNYTVATKAFVVDVTTTGPCWVQVTSSASPTPLISGVQPAGKKLSYPAQGTMTVQVGSSAVVVGISVKDKVVFYNAPRSTPFTYVFTPASS